MMERFRFIRGMIGDLEKHYLPSEVISRKYARRSLIANRLIQQDEVITARDLTCKRPGEGLPPWMIEWIIGRIAARDIEADKIISLGDIKFSE